MKHVYFSDLPKEIRTLPNGTGFLFVTISVSTLDILGDPAAVNRGARKHVLVVLVKFRENFRRADFFLAPR